MGTKGGWSRADPKKYYGNDDFWDNLAKEKARKEALAKEGVEDTPVASSDSVGSTIEQK